MTKTLTTETFTNEQLRDIAEGAMLTQLQDKIMARELLANREAQPVAATPIYQIWDDGRWYDTEGRLWREIYDDNCKSQFRIVYTAPPAPAVPDVGDWRIDESTGVQILMYRDCSVIEDQQARYVISLIHGGVPAVSIPDKVSCEGFNPKDWVEARNLGQCEGWNAYRAELLAQPVSSGYKLVPVEPTEEMIAAAMNCDDVEFNSDETFCVNFDNIYRAMLAAAPEGGN